MTNKSFEFSRRTERTLVRRKCGRTPVEFAAGLLTSRGNAMAQAFDFSEAGMLVVAPQGVEVGEAVTLVIAARGARLRVPAIVRWIDAAGSLDDYMIGCEFQPPAALRAKLKALAWGLACSPWSSPERLPA